MKKVRKSVNIWRRYGQKFAAYFFGPPASGRLYTVSNSKCRTPGYRSVVCTAGIAAARYNSAFRQHHQLCLSILKRFGYGQRVMETRILREVEEMVSRLQAEQGRAVDVKQLMTSCVANVIMSMLFGRRFDHSNPEFQQLMSDVNHALLSLKGELDLFPILRILPYYKRKMAHIVAVIERGSCIIDAEIKACHEVCSALSEVLYRVGQLK